MQIVIELSDFNKRQRLLRLASMDIPHGNSLLPGGVTQMHTESGMGSVSRDREEIWGKRNSSWQILLQAAETWAGSGRKLHTRIGRCCVQADLVWSLTLDVCWVLSAGQ